MILTSMVDIKALLRIICVLRIHIECALPAFKGRDLILTNGIYILEARQIDDRVTVHGMVVDLLLWGLGLFPSIRFDLRVVSYQIISLLGDPFNDRFRLRGLFLSVH